MGPGLRRGGFHGDGTSLSRNRTGDRTGDLIMHGDGTRGWGWWWGWGSRSLHLMRKYVNRLMIIPVSVLVDGERDRRNLVDLQRLLYLDSWPIIIIGNQIFVLTILALPSARVIMYP